MATRRQAFFLGLYVVQVIVLAVLAAVTYQWQQWVGFFFLACLAGSLVPLKAVWETWRERRAAARIGAPRPE